METDPREKEIEEINLAIISLKERRHELEQSMRADKFGIKVGEIFEWEGEKYKVDQLDMFWVTFRKVRDGGWESKNIKHAYKWEQYKQGKRNSPW